MLCLCLSLLSPLVFSCAKPLLFSAQWETDDTAEYVSKKKKIPSILVLSLPFSHLLLWCDIFLFLFIIFFFSFIFSASVPVLKPDVGVPIHCPHPVCFVLQPGVIV